MPLPVSPSLPLRPSGDDSPYKALVSDSRLAGDDDEGEEGEDSDVPECLIWH